MNAKASTLGGLAGIALLAHSTIAAGPKRQAMPIGNDWNLSGATLGRAKMDGAKVVQLVAKGDAKVKRGTNPLTGPWTLEGSAEVIECDFPGKKFVLKGPYSVVRKENGVKIEVVGPGPDSGAELDFRDGAVRTSGPNKTTVGDPEKPVTRAK
jgi:hypothetical protein